jgi:hypothetical protein
LGYGEHIATFKTLCPNERVSNASPGTSCFVQAKDQDMRDFRDAKAMAHTLRAALATKGQKVTNSESLELIAQAFRVADWNTLSAMIREEASASRDSASPPPPPTTKRVVDPSSLLAPLGQRHFSRELESTLRRALADANHREHEYATLEHLLLALIDDPDASVVMKSCSVDFGWLKKNLANYFDKELEQLVKPDGDDAKPTAGFQRVIQRAKIHIQSSGREEVTGANVLVAMFAERESYAALLLAEQKMTGLDAVTFMVNGIAKSGGDTAA